MSTYFGNFIRLVHLLSSRTILDDFELINITLHRMYADEFRQIQIMTELMTCNEWISAFMSTA